MKQNFLSFRHAKPDGAVAVYDSNHSVSFHFLNRFPTFRCSLLSSSASSTDDTLSISFLKFNYGLLNLRIFFAITQR